MPATKSAEWPKERIEKLIALCALDPRPSSREMAKKCGVTRNAVSGMKNRLGLSDPANNPTISKKSSMEKPYQPPVYGRRQTLPTLESLKDLPDAT